ncbi:N-acetylglucosaminyltransferase [Rhodospirillum centenum]|uniref:N-acetylglucosaminyltransferase, putative n=1 Tax=Rhodospirillum centenum (strain ATCC 51521 / SW) TaxID=414684 RepID=B6IYI4_RHOCS|nr:N-acetylglucosaminyltransferase [Rhodospirillum centenum]ACJ01358.1 N-acetylglucosaminyltransferase, putative [Rhodospirillum centenum SW]
MPRLIDCFIFFNELDVLEIRLRELAGVVDRFVLVEATHSFRGHPKDLVFAANRARFAPYLDRITHVVVDDMPCDPDPWVNERFQRNAIARGLHGAAPDDIVVVSDVDEIPRASVMAELRGTPFKAAGLRMRLYYVRLNYQNLVGSASHAVWSVAQPFARFRSAQAARDLRPALDAADGALPPGHLVLPDAGWHFSYLGDKERILNKVRNFSHAEIDTAALEALDIDGLMRSGTDLLGRGGMVWGVVPGGHGLPDAVLADPDRYAALLAPCDPADLDRTLMRVVAGGEALRRAEQDAPVLTMMRRRFRRWRSLAGLPALG